MFMSTRKSVKHNSDIRLNTLMGVAWWGNLRERGHWREPDVDGRIILRRIFRILERVLGTGWSWLRIGTGGGHL
jgi:hypothetical protein